MQALLQRRIETGDTTATIPSVTRRASPTLSPFAVPPGCARSLRPARPSD